MVQKLSYYQDIAKEDIENDVDRNEMFSGIDDMWNNEWSLPSSLANKEWMRSFITTAPHDAMLAATRVFASKLPSIAVLPLAPNAAEMEETEKVESLLEWQLHQTLRRGVDDPLWKMMNNATRYSMIAFQTEYLPMKFKERSDARAKSYLRNGEFAFVIHEPHNVHPRFSSYGLDSVTLAYLTTALDVWKLFGDKNPGVRKMIEQLKDNKEALASVMAKTHVTFYDYTDYDCRAQWISIGEQFDDTGGGGGAIEMLREEHLLPFLNWVVRKDDHPLMKPVYDADLWANANVLESLRYYLVISTVAQARSWSRTISGEGVEIDHTEPGAQAMMKSGEEFGMLPPAALDPNVHTLIQSVRGDIRQTTVAQALTTLENMPSGTPFATINAILQAAISTLAPIQNIGEAALEDGLHQMLAWAKYAKMPLNGYIVKSRSNVEETLSRGAQVMLSPDEYEPDNIYIKVTLDPESPTDRQARLNMAIETAGRLPISPRKAMEDNGMEYTDADQEEWLKWKFITAEANAREQKIMLKAQLEAQMQQQQMQQQQQTPQNETQAMNSNMATQGGDTRRGAPSPYEGRPGMTRESVTGRDMSGDEI